MGKLSQKNTIMKYNVTVLRTSYASREFTVEAPTEEAAKEIAEMEACNETFTEDDADYKIEDIRIVG